MTREANKAYIALGLVSFFWGTTYIAARIGTQHMPGLFVSGIRQFSSGFILVSFFLARGYSIPAWETLKKISLQGILLLAVANGLLTWQDCFWRRRCMNEESKGHNVVTSVITPSIIDTPQNRKSMITEPLDVNELLLLAD